MAQGMIKFMRDPSGALSFRAVLKKELEMYVHILTFHILYYPESPLLTERKI
jgi:hypothetical protein